MAATELYIPVGVESIRPDHFPDVALYLKSGNNYVLYKSHGQDFTATDAERLIENSIDFLYVSPGDLEVITQYLESNARRMLNDKSFDDRTRGKIIYQTSINFVGDIFFHPEKVGDFERGKRLIENLLLYLSSDPEALGSLESVMSHNYYTFVHCLQVTTLSIMMHSEAYMLSHDELVDVGIGTILHDFGKVFVPQEILNKAKPTDADVAEIRKHPEAGYRYLREHTHLSEISLAIVRYHHERNNGMGYPAGLRGDQIPRSAQVAAVCDVYCTLTMDRTCRKALPPHLAIHIMKQEMKGALNEKLLGTLEKLVCVEDAEDGLLF